MQNCVSERLLVLSAELSEMNDKLVELAVRLNL